MLPRKKRARLSDGNLGGCPSYGLVPDSGPAASAGLQAACVGAKREPMAKNSLEKFRVVDELRVVPPNFDESVRGAFLRVPDEALPQQESKGRFNYTLRIGLSVFEIQLANRAFVLKKNIYGEDVKRSENYTPICSWIGMNGADVAWEVAKQKAQQKLA